MVVGVVGSSSFLSCNMTPPSLRDAVYLVLWYKDEDPLPVYSYDARDFTKKRWSEDKMFGARATFRDTVSPAQLRIDRLERTDGGRYTCRVDFRDSPTVTSSTVLEVVEQSSKPVVITEAGVEVMGSVGPYQLGQSLILVCMAEGDPPPLVVWTRDGEVWDEVMDPGAGGGGQRRNTLVISPLEREHSGTRLSCRAENEHIQQPPHTDISLELSLPVLEVRIVNLPSPLRADSQYEALCQVVGARPPPSISWTLTTPLGVTHNLSASLPQLSARGNLSSSLLQLNITEEDHASELTCTAAMEMFPAVRRSRVLDVSHAPRVRLVMVGDVSRLVAGDSLELSCEAEARPGVQEYLWYRDGAVRARGEVLTVESVVPGDSGQYWCQAVNSEGVGQSGKVKVAVVYRPVCQAPTVTQHPENFSPGVSLTCNVDSKPPARNYRWQYNSSQGSFEIPNAKSMMSFMNYAVSEEGGEGEVLCWASNELGEQSEPCVFHVVPLGVPHTPRDCQVTENTESRVSVSCSPGYSGGEPQHFVLSLLDMVGGLQTPVKTNWSDQPDLSLTDLSPAQPRLLSVHSANSQGKSDPVYLTTEIPAPTSHSQEVPPDRQSVLYIIVSVLASIMVLSLLLSLSHFCRRRKALAQLETEKPSHPSSVQSSPLLPQYKAQVSPGSPLLSQHRAQVSPGSPLLSQYRAQVSPSSPLLPRSMAQVSQSSPLLAQSRGQMTPGSPLLALTESSSLSNSEHVSSLRRKVSFTQSSPRTRSVGLLTPASGVQSTVIKSYSIDKLRPICHTCNPDGDTPYPLSEDTIS